MKHWWKKSKRTQTDGEIYCVHGLEESTLWKWVYYAKQPIDSMQSLSSYQQYFSQNYLGYFLSNCLYETLSVAQEDFQADSSQPTVKGNQRANRKCSSLAQLFNRMGSSFEIILLQSVADHILKKEKCFKTHILGSLFCIIASFPNGWTHPLMTSQENIVCTENQCAQAHIG